MQNTQIRPNPDELLVKIQEEEKKEQRGRLKIFFGACAGVGKTYALLNNAQALRAQNLDLVVGIIETHGRKETAELLKNLEILPRKEIEYRGKVFHELDLDAALARKPSLILIDELAHTNIRGSRHEKRWQDIEELLNAGIDVHTTVNVQHIESLSDVVTQITGIHISETFPDHVFDNADEVTLVDLPTEELLQRLKEGKVYIPEQTAQAVQNFFRKGNLIALRELALRKMADRVDVQMLEYREDEDIQKVWHTKERLLVCVGPQENSEKIIRSAYRLANNLHADWFAVYVETPRLQRLSKIRREQVLKNLKLAEELGAEAITLSGNDIVKSLIDFSHENNITKIVIGKATPRFWWFSKNIPEELTKHIEDIDLYIIGQEKPTRRFTKKFIFTESSLELRSPKNRNYFGYLWTAISCVLITVLGYILRFQFNFEESDVIMFYILNIAFIALRFGHGPSALASLVSVATFDFFFIPPQFSFTVEHPHALVTFAIMLTVGMLISNLTSNLRYQVRIASYREQRTRAVYSLSKDLSSALSVPQVINLAANHISNVFKVHIMFLLPDSHEKLYPTLSYIESDIKFSTPDLAVAQWAYDNHQAAGWSTSTLPASVGLYLPLKAPTHLRGVLAIQPLNPNISFLPEQKRLLETFTNQIAQSLERMFFIEISKKSKISIETERLRSVLLTIIYRDLRSPLNDIVNLTNMLSTTSPEKLNITLETIASTLPEKAQLVNSFINNLLDMAHLQVNGIELHRQLNDLHKIVDLVMQTHAYLLKNHRIIFNRAKDLKLFYFDAVMVERVLSNLLENAGKYTPQNSTITISIVLHDDAVWVHVDDNGPGLPAEMEEDEIFGKFTRGKLHAVIPGTGLGLAVCRAIVEAHNGRILAQNLSSGGARFSFWLPYEVVLEKPSPTVEVRA